MTELLHCAVLGTVVGFLTWEIRRRINWTFGRKKMDRASRLYNDMLTIDRARKDR